PFGARSRAMRTSGRTRATASANSGARNGLASEASVRWRARHAPRSPFASSAGAIASMVVTRRPAWWSRAGLRRAAGVLPRRRAEEAPDDRDARELGEGLEERDAVARVGQHAERRRERDGGLADERSRDEGPHQAQPHGRERDDG